MEQAEQALLGHAALGMGEGQELGGLAKEGASMAFWLERLPSWSWCKLGQSVFLHLHEGAIWG